VAVISISNQNYPKPQNHFEPERPGSNLRKGRALAFCQRQICRAWVFTSFSVI